MPKAGNLKSTFIVTSDDLKVNGGRWLLQSGPAIRVRGFNSSSIGDREVIHGDALPIYILQESDARVNGGQWLLKGGQPIQATDVIGSARGVIQGKAIPVWPVDDDGNYDPTFASYSGRIIATQPGNLIGYWTIGEVAGAISEDSSGNNHDGAYNLVTLGQPGIGDGGTSGLWHNNNSYNNLLSVPLATAFNGVAGTMFCWIQMLNAGVWIDGSNRYVSQLGVDGANRILLWKTNINHTMQFQYSAGGVAENIVHNFGVGPVNFFNVALTWDRNAGPNGEVKAYISGIQTGATQVTLGVWVGVPVTMVLGSFGTPSALRTSGFLAHCALWTVALTQSEIANIATV